MNITNFEKLTIIEQQELKQLKDLKLEEYKQNAIEQFNSRKNQSIMLS
jgi:hypothetical protein